MGSVIGMDRKQEDEIGLWTIEKRVSFSVSGVSERRGSSSEVVRDGKGESSSQVEILGVREREREGDNGYRSEGDIGAGRVTTTVGLGNHGSHRTRNTSRSHRGI